MKKNTNISGYLLILASICFFASWWLMPDPGTTNTKHILSIVQQSRIQVLSSVIIQIISSVLYTIAAFVLIRNNRIQKTAFAGSVLLAIGAMGLCADAFFHLLAYYMTSNNVTIQQDVVMVMNYMQTDALVFLIPLLLPFIAGSILLTAGLDKQAVISKWPRRTIIAALLFGLAGAIITRSAGSVSGAALSMMVLALFSVAQIHAGLQLVSRRKTVAQMRWSMAATLQKA